MNQDRTLKKPSDSTTRFSSGRALQVLLRGLLASGVGAFATLALHLLLGRILGPDEYGGFVFSLGLAMLVSQLAPLGWPTLMTRLIAEYSEKKKWGLLKGVTKRSWQMIAVSCVLSVLAISLFASLLPSERNLTYVTQLAAVLAPLLAVRYLVKQQLIGLQHPVTASFVDLALPSLVTIALLSVVMPDTGIQAYNLYAIGAVISLGVMLLLLFRNYPPETKSVKAKYSSNLWMRSASAIVLGSIANNVILRVDTLMIGPMIGPDAVGLYGAASRLTHMLSFATTVVATVISPSLAAAYYARDLASVKRLYLLAAACCGIIALPIALVFLSIPNEVLSFAFGQEFSSASRTLAILTLGQLSAALVGPSGIALVMVGKHMLYGISLSIVAVANVIGNLYAIPNFGISGAAAITSASILANSLIVSAIFVNSIWRSKQ